MQKNVINKRKRYTHRVKIMAIWADSSSKCTFLVRVLGDCGRFVREVSQNLKALRGVRKLSTFESQDHSAPW